MPDTSEFSTRGINDMTENTTIHETDAFIIGENGQSTLKKVTLSTLFSYLQDRMSSWTLNALDTASKTITGAINEVLSGLTNGSVSKVGTQDVGSKEKPIYLSGGTPTASDASVGGTYTPAYMAGGTISPCGFSLRHGQVTVSNETMSITFPTAFRAGVVPQVVATPICDNPESVSVTDVSNTGFTLHTKSTGIYVDWIAAGEGDD